MRRTQEQIDALWPKDCDTYHVAGLITVEGAKTPQDAAQVLQKLYEGPQAMAGSFEVAVKLNAAAHPDAFSVEFTRDVHDDAEVVNAALAQGREFLATLTDQLKREIKLAAKDQKLPVTVLRLDQPLFTGNNRKKR